MLSLLRLFFATTLLLPFAAYAQDAPPPASNHFHSDTLHLSFDVPDDILVRPELAVKINEGLTNSRKTPTGDPCTTVPLLAFNPKVIRRLYLYQTDAACFPDGLTQERLRASATGILTAVLHNMGKPTVASPIDYDLGSKPAVVVSGSVFSDQNHGIVFGEIGCVRLETHSVCWLFVSSTAAKTARLAETPVTFDNQPPTPIIPADASEISMPSTATFRNDALHFALTYPGSFVDAEQRTTTILARKAEDAQGKEKSALTCMKTSFTGDELTDDAHSTILIFNFNADCQKLKLSTSVLRDLARGVAKGIAKSAAKSKVEDPIPYTLAGHEAVLVQAAITSDKGITARVAEACAIIANDVTCFQFYSTSPDRLLQMSASKIAFTGQLPTPVVPPNLLKQP